MKRGERAARRLGLAPLLLLAGLATGCGSARDGAPPRTLACGMSHCPGPLTACGVSERCRDTLDCNRRCSEAHPDGVGEQTCHLLCQLEEGVDSRPYRRVVQCFADHACLPRAPEGLDGACPVTPENTGSIVPVESLSQLEGTWLELRGRNCGRPDSTWQGGYDHLGCRSSSWVPAGGDTWYHTSFAGSRGPAGPHPFLVAEPAVAPDGGLEVHYLNPPLTPQIERWYVLSRPDDDWIAYTYCGSTPAGSYAGANIITRSGVSAGADIPAEIAEAMREDLARFGLAWVDFCDIDHRGCAPPRARAEVLQRVAD
ncbi:MAG: hypothetical protein JXX28_15965 [Deltaproteobacteria bacterium]|nr:hypothetical protein [Deltaproteobacteria bacterium]